MGRATYPARDDEIFCHHDGTIIVPTHPDATADGRTTAFVTLVCGHGADEPARGSVTTAPLPDAEGKRLLINADQLSGEQTIHIEVLGADGDSIPGYEALMFETLDRDGVDLPACWGGRDRLPGGHGPISLCFIFNAPRRVHTVCPRMYAFALSD